MRVLLALVTVTQCGGLMAQQYATTERQVQADENLKAAKSLDFVNKVRDDLRRNNDDYVVLDRQNRLESAPRPAPRHHPRNLRRGDGDGKPAPLNQTRQLQINQSAAEFRRATHAPPLKSLRVSDIKKRVNRDKDVPRFRDHEETGDTTSSTLPTTTTTKQQRTATSPETRAPTTSPPPRRQHTPQPEPSPAPPAPPAPAALLRDFQRQLWQTPGPRRPSRNPAPLPDQIDMAHARNPIITRIRLKGRLCQRSLMNIEGPTYDRLGKQVMPEHDPRHARGRQFHQTRAPELVLPKCCNCCKKSVLGCQ